MIKINTIINFIYFYALSISSNYAHALNEDALMSNQRNLVTMIALSTQEYNVSICKNGKNSDYFYTAQEKNTDETIFLPITEINNPHKGANPWILKAVNGKYTYQVAEFNPLGGGGDNSYVCISVFESGKKIYHRIVTKYIGSDE